MWWRNSVAFRILFGNGRNSEKSDRWGCIKPWMTLGEITGRKMKLKGANQGQRVLQQDTSRRNLSIRSIKAKVLSDLTFHGLLTNVTMGPRIRIMSIEFLSGTIGSWSSAISPRWIRSSRRFSYMSKGQRSGSSHNTVFPPSVADARCAIKWRCWQVLQ